MLCWRCLPSTSRWYWSEGPADWLLLELKSARGSAELCLYCWRKRETTTLVSPRSSLLLSPISKSETGIARYCHITLLARCVFMAFFVPAVVYSGMRLCRLHSLGPVSFSWTQERLEDDTLGLGKEESEFQLWILPVCPYVRAGSWRGAAKQQQNITTGTSSYTRRWNK